MSVGPKGLTVVGVDDCRDYLRTGKCKYGSQCKYNHPIGGNYCKSLTHINPSEPMYPIRPNEPACPYFLRYGTCKFGQTCKFHHPPHNQRSTNDSNKVTTMLPQRPSELDCVFFLKNGHCKFGSTCKFHHPLSVLALMKQRSSYDMEELLYANRAQDLNHGSGVRRPASASSASELYPFLVNNSDTHNPRSSAGTTIPVPAQMIPTTNPNTNSPVLLQAFYPMNNKNEQRRTHYLISNTVQQQQHSGNIGGTTFSHNTKLRSNSLSPPMDQYYPSYPSTIPHRNSSINDSYVHSPTNGQYTNNHVSRNTNESLYHNTTQKDPSFDNRHYTIHRDNNSFLNSHHHLNHTSQQQSLHQYSDTYKTQTELPNTYHHSQYHSPSQHKWEVASTSNSSPMGNNSPHISNATNIQPYSRNMKNFTLSSGYNDPHTMDLYTNSASRPIDTTTTIPSSNYNNINYSEHHTNQRLMSNNKIAQQTRDDYEDIDGLSKMTSTLLNLIDDTPSQDYFSNNKDDVVPSSSDHYLHSNTTRGLSNYQTQQQVQYSNGNNRVVVQPQRNHSSNYCKSVRSNNTVMQQQPQTTTNRAVQNLYHKQHQSLSSLFYDQNQSSTMSLPLF